MPEMPLRVWWSRPNKWRVDRQPPLVALADGLLVVVERNEVVTHVSLAAAEMTATAGGCTLRWRDGVLRPSLRLPEFAGQDELAGALRAARLETAPLRSSALAKLFPVVPIRPSWSWIRATAFIVLFILPQLIVRYLSWLALLPIWAAALWFEFTRHDHRPVGDDHAGPHHPPGVPDAPRAHRKSQGAAGGVAATVTLAGGALPVLC